MQVKFEVLKVYAAAAIYDLAITNLRNVAQRGLEARYGRDHVPLTGDPA